MTATAPWLGGRTGLFGGTFNPIHIGHLHIAQEALLALGLDRVVFIPNRLPPHRGAEAILADAEHRAVMTEIATADHPQFFVSRIELLRAEPSYTVDTVRTLREQVPHAELIFITGADAVLRYVWKDFDTMLGMLETLVAVTRPGFDLAALDRKIDGLNLTNRSRIQTLEISGYAVSSTEIRARLAQGRPVRYMLTREVEAYIRKFSLYESLASKGR